MSDFLENRQMGDIENEWDLSFKYFTGDMEIWKKLTAIGMMGALVYVLHVIIGGMLWEGYNHLMQPISDLTAQGAPNRALLEYFTWTYGIFSVIFAFSAFMCLRKTDSRLLKAGLIIFLCMHIVSMTYGLFPEDLSGASMTFRGFMHYVVTGIIIPLTILSPVLIGAGLRKAQGFRTFSVYSIVTGIIIFAAGGISVYFAANGLSYFGLFERINIGSLQLWMFIFSLKLFKFDLPDKVH
jgi:hypothetical protein